MHLKELPRGLLGKHPTAFTFSQRDIYVHILLYCNMIIGLLSGREEAFYSYLWV